MSSFNDFFDHGKKRGNDGLDVYILEATNAFNSQTIEKDQKKFINDYLVRKGKNMSSKEKSILLKNIENNPALYNKVKEFFLLDTQEDG